MTGGSQEKADKKVKQQRATQHRQKSSENVRSREQTNKIYVEPFMGGYSDQNQPSCLDGPLDIFFLKI